MKKKAANAKAKGVHKNIVTKGGKAGRAIENKMRSQMKLPKLQTTGKIKAVRKVQKGINKTDARVPGSTKLRAEIKNNKVYATDEFGSYRQRGSNRKAAKGTGPKRSPGVKKNKSLQRGINKSNLRLRDTGRGTPLLGGMGGGPFGPRVR